MKRFVPILIPKLESRTEKVGEQIRIARLRRNFSATEVAKRSGISRATLNKIENGDPNVAFGSYCAVLHTLGLDEDIEQLAANDTLGKDIDERNTLRKRASKKRNQKNYTYKVDPHTLSEARSLAMHRVIANYIKENPEPIIEKAKSNIIRWSDSNGFKNSANTEWLQILSGYTPKEIANLISSNSEEAYRLRSSSPFTDILSPSEIKEIKNSVNI